jgi:hypothetical protein
MPETWARDARHMVSTGDQLSIEEADPTVRRLGEPTVASPMARLRDKQGLSVRSAGVQMTFLHSG